MNQDTIDRLDSALTLIRNGNETYEPLIEAIGNDDDERCAKVIYNILSCPAEQLEANRDALWDALSAYFKIEDAVEADIIDYREKAYGDFSPEKEVQIA